MPRKDMYADPDTGEVLNVKFGTQWIVPLFSYAEKGDPRSITETAYVPPQVQIQDMIDAGARLAAARKARFDTVELQLDAEDDDVPLDPTRQPGVDLVDVQKAAQAVSTRLQEAKSALQVAAEKKAAADAKAADDARVEALVKARLESLEAVKQGT